MLKIDKKDNAKKEFDMLKRLDNSFLIKLIGDDLYFHDDFCYIITEFYQVNHKTLIFTV